MVNIEPGYAEEVGKDVEKFLNLGYKKITVTIEEDGTVDVKAELEPEK